MRILVLSDSHNRISLLETIIAAQPSAAALVFLGDGLRDLEAVPVPCPVFSVRGNGDLGSPAPLTREDVFADKRLFCTHGHAFEVKFSDDKLLAAAKHCDIALYGHTHRQVLRWAEGLMLFNPGAAALGDYGVLDFTPAGVAAVHMHV